VRRERLRVLWETRRATSSVVPATARTAVRGD
jgi:hypothetical protein